MKHSIRLTHCCINLASVCSIDSTSLRSNGQNTKAEVTVLLLTDNQEKLLNWQWFKYALWCEYIHCRPKKTSLQLNLLQLFEFSKYIYRILDAYTSIIFIKICESFVEIDGIITNSCNFKVYWGEKQVSEIFQIFQSH